MNKEPLSAGSVWQFQQALTRRLGWGAAVSILLGLAMLLFRTSFWNAAAIQFIAWAMIDLLIALGGDASTRRRKARLNPEQVLSTQPREARSLRRILWINTGLDVFYMLGGTLIAVFPGDADAFWLGTGVGILLQGAFLFFFDWYHAVQASKYL